MTEQHNPLSYPQDTGRVDEVYTLDGDTRRQWAYLLDSLTTLGRAELAARQRKVQRILRDDGATYTSTEHPSQSTIWEMDPVPMLLESDEWSQIETGLIERAELLDLVLKDLYGERLLVRQGIIPADLVFGHHGFLRACHGLKIPGEKQLFFHSADMIRDSNGNVCILSDRTQVPRGIGYALENRTVMTRVFPSLFRDSQVHRLALFYQTLRQKLQDLANQITDDNPRIVVMTPGAYSPSYFEHTFLANYLGYPLVQGGDLTVRSGHVWMKSVGGLERVDVILRFVDDAYCDPVELRSDSHLGVAGLLEVARSGHVAVVNPIGAGVLENPALLKYLSQASEFFLGRKPELKSVNTYWCGDKDDLNNVLNNFDRMVLKTVNAKHDNRSVFICELSKKEQAHWRQILLNQPERYVAQDYLEPSQSPTWVNGELQPRRILMRSFSVATENAYSVLPGGLARIAPDKRSFRVTNGKGSLSKDTWVLASEPEKQISLQAQPKTRHLPQESSTFNLPSRVVENLFWMGRYAERAEFTARLLRTVFLQLNSTARLPRDLRQRLLCTVTEATNTLPGFRGEDAAELFESPDAELTAVILDGNRPGTLRHSLHLMLNCGEEVKELLGSDAQRIVNDIRDELSKLDSALSDSLTSAPEESLDPLVTCLLALAGQTNESMFRGTGWHFIELGRRLEKAYQSASLIRSLLVDCFGDRSQEIALETLLLANEALISYRRRYLAQPDVHSGLHLMLQDRSNPRSLLFLLQVASDHLNGLAEDTRQQSLSHAQKELLSATTALQLSEIEHLIQSDENGLLRNELDEFLANLQEQIYNVAARISDQYFDHTGGPQQLVQTDWESEA